MEGLGPYRRRDLVREGVSDRELAREVSTGRLVRLRPGMYCRPDLDGAVQSAVSAGGRLTCASELRRQGVWVVASSIHAHFSPHRGRIAPGETTRHLDRLTRAPSEGAVALVDAVIQALRCLPRPHAVAALDSIRHQRLISPEDLEWVAKRSRRASMLVAESDPRAESGLETLARLIARDAGLSVRSQVHFAGIGRVDLLIENAVVVEADGDAFHSDVAARRRDRRRDAALAAVRRPVLRFGFDQLTGQPDRVARAMIEAVRIHRQVKNSGRIADRALIRARNSD